MDTIKPKLIRNFDAEFCGNVPLNYINHVQDYGCLVVLDQEMSILQVSENCNVLLGKPAPELAGKNLNEFLSPAHIALLAGHRDIKNFKTASFPLRWNNANEFLCVVHNSDPFIVLELEPPSKPSRGYGEVSPSKIRSTIYAVSGALEVQQMLDTATSELKRISGFDKVMIYQFDEQWNGNVVAETMEKGMESYLGLWFPASDIPRQAREMYEKNVYRLIPDRSYKAAKLYPVLNPALNSFINLGNCNLRGVVKVHLEYLENMNVKSSMSTRILKDGKLWGLISCHHREPLFLNYDDCLIFELLSSIISSSLTSLEAKTELQVQHGKQHLLVRIIDKLHASRHISDCMSQALPLIAELLNCSSAVYLNGDNVIITGNCPPQNELVELSLWLRTRGLKGVYHTPALISEYERWASLTERFSGMLVIPVQPDKLEFVAAFRPELRQEVRWGGDPNQAVVFGKDNSTYHPRNSFKIWQQTIEGMSAPFNSAELTFAGELQSILLRSRLEELNSVY